MADPTFDQISATTLADLRDDIVTDNFFVDSTTLRKLRLSGALDEYSGGTAMQNPFQYDRVNGGAIAPGSDVNVSQKQIIAATAFTPREYLEQIGVNLFQVGVVNAGPAGKVKIIDAYMTNAVQAANTDLGIDIFRHGQASPSGATSAGSRPNAINGFSEAMNDGVTNAWDGGIYTTYGGQTRGAAIGNTLNSVPIWLGDANGGTGQITYKPLIEAYLNCVQDPDLGICNKALFAYLLERTETKQRYAEEQDVKMGMSGIRVMNALIMVDKLCPSTKYGTLLPAGLSQTTAVLPSTFTSASSGISSISGLPASKTINPGEPFFWIRSKGWKVRPTTDPEYNFNFTPWVRSQTNADLVVGFFKIALNVYTTGPRDNVQMFGAGF